MPELETPSFSREPIRTRVKNMIIETGSGVLLLAPAFIAIDLDPPTLVKVACGAVFAAECVVAVYVMKDEDDSEAFEDAEAESDNTETSPEENWQPMPTPTAGYKMDHSVSPPMLQKLVGWNSEKPRDSEN